MSYLCNLPKNLDETYERMLEAVLKKRTEVQAKMVRNLLGWMVTSYKPLKANVAMEAVLQHPDNVSKNRKLPDWDALLEICVGLIKILKYRNGVTRVLFIHYSVKEYLLSDRISHSKASFFSIDAEQSHRDVAQICLSYMFRFDGPNFRLEEERKAHPLLQYSCVWWIDHFIDGKGKDHDEVMKLVRKFFDTSRQRFFIMWQTMNPILAHNYVGAGSHLYHAVGIGIVEIVRSLLVEGEDPNAGPGYEGYPIQIAAKMIRSDIISLLIDYGADVNKQSGLNSSPLILACENGNLQLVNFLLKVGADPNMSGSAPLASACKCENVDIIQRLLKLQLNRLNFKKALSVTAELGSEKLFSLLMDNDKSGHLQSKKILTNALVKFCIKGSATCSRLLIDEGADVNQEICFATWSIMAESYLTPLEAASENGHHALVELLLDKGADVTKISKGKGNALKVAASNGHNRIISILLDNGADIDCPLGYLYGTPLQQAVLNKYLSTVNLLLERGADKYKGLGEDGASAFDQAVSMGYVECVKIFIDHGLNFERLGGKCNDLVLLAMSKKNEEIINLLVGSWDRVQLLVDKFGSLLHGAAFVNNEDFVSLALYRGEDINITKNSCIPLQLAVCQGHLDMAELLLKKGADVNFLYQGTTSLLYIAAESHEERFCRLLIDYGAHINKVQGRCGTPLQAAMANGNYTSCLKLLLERGADVNLFGGDGACPLSIAVERSCKDLVESLLEHGADPNCNGMEYSTVLQMACRNGDLSSAWMLIDAGANINGKGEDEQSPVEIAFNNSDELMFRALLELGAHIPATIQGKELPKKNEGYVFHLLAFPRLIPVLIF